MAYNTRRSGEGIYTVGARRNPPIRTNFVRGGQLAPLFRPQQQHRPQGPHSNGNFRPQMQQRMPGHTPQRGPPPVQQKGGPGPKIQQQRPPQQQQQQPPPQQQIIPQDPSEEIVKNENQMETKDQIRKKPFWATKVGKISKKERQQRRNVRLSKILQPKNAVMILNELVKSATYTVTDLPQPSEMNQYTATVLVDGISHVGHGRSKMDAKSMAAENALKYIIKNRQFSALKKDDDGDEKMEIGPDGTPMVPWHQVASFALYKLLNSWGEDPNQAKGQEGGTVQNPQTRAAKKMPEHAAQMNPLMLLNQMLPHAQFEELERTGNPPNVIFTFKCTVDGQTFTGTGANKKAAKRMAAFAVCHKILEIQYTPEVYTPTTN